MRVDSLKPIIFTLIRYFAELGILLNQTTSTLPTLKDWILFTSREQATQATAHKRLLDGITSFNYMLGIEGVVNLVDSKKKALEDTLQVKYMGCRNDINLIGITNPILVNDHFSYLLHQ